MTVQSTHEIAGETPAQGASPAGAQAPGVKPAKPKSRRAASGSWQNAATFVLSIVLGIGIWQVAAMFSGPTILASPAETFTAAIELARDGRLWDSTYISLQRILIGWGIGVAVGVPIGILTGRIKIVSALLEPYIQFFRFIPPVALVTLAIAWFGMGEMSKVSLIFYTTVFIVIVNTQAGVFAIPDSKLRAAASLGANPRQILGHIVLPSTIPYIVTGARLAMGNSFLTIVAAEMVAAQEGLGSLIWTSRNFGRIDWIIVGIIMLGVIGFLCDLALRKAGTKMLKRYGVKA